MMLQDNNQNSDKWYYILAKNRSCQGYFPGVTPEDACRSFGMSIKDCYFEEVIITDIGFQPKDNIEQLKLF